MYTSHQIANYFIRKSHATGIELTPIKLMKLSYLAHGWHLGFYDTELLGEAIYAWKFGPLIETLHQDFMKYGLSQISALYSYKGYYPLPDQEIEPFLDNAWEVYGKYDSRQLSALAIELDTPWYIVWNQEGGWKREKTIISNELIKQYYKQKIASNYTILNATGN